MSFFALHRRNVLERIPISKKEILPGDIIEFRYTKKDGKKDIRYTDKPEDRGFFPKVRVTRKPLSVRVKLAAYEKLEDLPKVLNLPK